MTPVAVISITLTSFLLGMYLGRRSTRAEYREQLTRVERQYQKVIDFADEYIDTNAPRRALHVVRNADGHIVDLLMRCGTPALMAKEILEERHRRKALH